METVPRPVMLGIAFHSHWEKAMTVVQCEPSSQATETLPRQLQITATLTCTTWEHHSVPIGWVYSGSALLWP
jgi:hypothetical protein